MRQRVIEKPFGSKIGYHELEDEKEDADEEWMTGEASQVSGGGSRGSSNWCLKIMFPILVSCRCRCRNFSVCAGGAVALAMCDRDWLASSRGVAVPDYSWWSQRYGVCLEGRYCCPCIAPSFPRLPDLVALKLVFLVLRPSSLVLR